MDMIKFYLSTAIIYFIIFTASGIVLKKEYERSIRKIRGSNDYYYNYLKNIMYYFLVSLIPIFRIIFLILKFYIVFFPEKAIELLEKKK